MMRSIAFLVTAKAFFLACLCFPCQKAFAQPDAAFFHQGVNKTYFFVGNQYYRLSGTKADPGYPKRLPGGWQGLPARFAGGIDAALFRQDNGKIYFFKGSEYVRITGTKVDRGYPKNIMGNWTGLPVNFQSRIDAAIYRAGKTYFFKGNQYARMTGSKMDSGYPQKMPGGWKIPGSFQSNLNAALNFQPNSKNYFFKNGKYIRLSDTKTDAGYPTTFPGGWKGIKAPQGSGGNFPKLSGYYNLKEVKHSKCLVAGNRYDGNVYHQNSNNSPTAEWKFVSAGNSYYYIYDKKHGKALVAGDSYNGRVYHQDPQNRPNAQWKLEPGAASGTWYIKDRKHGKYLVSGNRADNNMYHQDHQGRPNASFRLVSIEKPSGSSKKGLIIPFEYWTYPTGKEEEEVVIPTEVLDEIGVEYHSTPTGLIHITDVKISTLKDKLLVTAGTVGSAAAAVGGVIGMHISSTAALAAAAKAAAAAATITSMGGAAASGTAGTFAAALGGAAVGAGIGTAVVAVGVSLGVGIAEIVKKVRKENGTHISVYNTLLDGATVRIKSANVGGKLIGTDGSENDTKEIVGATANSTKDHLGAMTFELSPHDGNGARVKGTINFEIKYKGKTFNMNLDLDNRVAAGIQSTHRLRMQGLSPIIFQSRDRATSLVQHATIANLFDIAFSFNHASPEDGTLDQRKDYIQIYISPKPSKKEVNRVNVKLQNSSGFRPKWKIQYTDAGGNQKTEEVIANGAPWVQTRTLDLKPDTRYSVQAYRHNQSRVLGTCRNLNKDAIVKVTGTATSPKISCNNDEILNSTGETNTKIIEITFKSSAGFVPLFHVTGPGIDQKLKGGSAGHSFKKSFKIGKNQYLKIKATRQDGKKNVSGEVRVHKNRIVTVRGTGNRASIQ